MNTGSNISESVNNIDISVLVRTIGRPQVLNEALVSLRGQNFKNFEIIIVEDGPEISKDFIFSNFSDLRIRYFCTGTKVGRTRAGNLCLREAKGEYLIFLDDDDMYFPDHLEILFNTLKREKNYKASYSIAYAVPTTTISIDPYNYRENKMFIQYSQPFSRLLLFLRNYIPIQAILFHKSLYEQYGGFDETLEFLEDWDLWMRYAVNNDFKYIPKITSKYRVPANIKEWNERGSLKFERSEEMIREKQKNIIISITASESVKEIEMILKSSNRALIKDRLKFFVCHPFKAFIQFYHTGFDLSAIFPR
jgi:glycosyltransferase involved in cell wall biosynthesis